MFELKRTVPQEASVASCSRCPLRVISGHKTRLLVMSALPPKRTFVRARWDVRFVPIADIPHRPGEDGSGAILMAN